MMQFAGGLVRRIGSAAICSAAILGAGTAVAQDAAPGRDAGQQSAVAVAQLVDELMLSGLAPRAIELASAQRGVAGEKVEIVSSATAGLNTLGMTIYQFKTLADGQPVFVALDTHGNAVDGDALVAQDREAFEALHGRVDEVLANALPAMAAGEQVMVAIWLRESAPAAAIARPAPDADVTEQGAEELLRGVQQARRVEVDAVTQPVVAGLSQLGVESAADGDAPLVYALVPASLVRDVSMWDEVDRVYHVPAFEPELNIARRAIYRHLISPTTIDGTGVKVGVVEVQGGRINAANPFLQGVTQDGTNMSCVSQHGAGVVGIIKNTSTTHRGIAHGANVFLTGVCNPFLDPNTDNLHNRSTAAADWGARAINLSWGANIGLTPGVSDRFYDDMIINRWISVVKSAGNQADVCGAMNGNVTSPGLGYNVITVGNFDDKGTDWPHDDSMGLCSSFKNPTSLHSSFSPREKPELAAPGTNITTTGNASTWLNYTDSGTSFAAPMVTGTLALMMQGNTSLQFWPEPAKAILMASCFEDKDGVNTVLSDKDGAGGLDANRAVSAARLLVSGGWGGSSYDCTQPFSKDVATIDLVAGKRTRIAFSYNTDPSYASYASQPSADLAIQLIAPNGAVFASSDRWDDTFELIDFIPPTTGAWKLRVLKWRCDVSPRFIGWAWCRNL